MALKTWEIKVKDRTIKVKALKKETEAISQAINNLIGITQHFTEITGTTEGKGHRTTYFSPFGSPGKVENQEEYDKDLNDFFNELPAIITDTKLVIEQARSRFKKHLPIVDNRKTPQEVQERNEAVNKSQIAQDAKNQAFRDEFCGEKIQVPDGQMAVTLEVTFNDSDIMTDYFNHHASIGPTMIIGLVPKQARKEAIARQVLARYPELHKLEWTWHTENYSGGHGNYLESGWTGNMMKKTAYDGRKEVNTRYEISFNAWGKESYTYKDYPGKMPEVKTGQDKTVASNGDITITENEEKDGVEIRFTEKPDVSTRSSLKSRGFRWSKFAKCWYKKRTPEILAYAHGLVTT